MTEIEKKALALLNEATNSNSDDIEDFSRSGVLKALLHAIEQHEQFKREVSDTVRGLRQDMKAEQKHTDNALDNMDAAYRRVAELEEFARAVVRYAGNGGDDYLADKARAALGESHDQ